MDSFVGVGGTSSPWFADIGEAWAATGYDPGKKIKDPLCQLYSDQFHKVQEALWQSKFPDYDKYFPYADKKKQLPPNKPPQEEEEERLLEMYIEKGEDHATESQTKHAPNPSTRHQSHKDTPKSKRHQEDDSTTNNKSPILELLLFVVCGLFLILLLDLFFRMGYTMGRLSVG